MVPVRRRGEALLLGLASGALLVGGVSAAPVEIVPTSAVAALGRGTAARDATSSAAPTSTITLLPRTSAPASTFRTMPPAEPTPTPTPSSATTTPPPGPTTTPTMPSTTSTDPTTTPTPTPSAPAPAGSGGGLAAAVVSATNAERREAGCDALDTDSRLAAAAQGHASDMAENDYFEHEGRDGGNFIDRISAEDYPSPGGENIAYGQHTADEVVRAWMKSPGHRRNILNCSFTSIGVGYDSHGDFWVQNFGR